MSVWLLKTLVYPYTKQVSCLLAFFALFFIVLSPASAEDYRYAEPADMYQSPAIARSAYEKRRTYLREKRLQVYQRKPINPPSHETVSELRRKPIGTPPDGMEDTAVNVDAMQALAPAAGPPQPLMDEPPIPDPQERVLIDVPAAPTGVKGFQFRRRPINSYSQPALPTEETVVIPQVEVSSPPDVMPASNVATEPLVPLTPLTSDEKMAPAPEPIISQAPETPVSPPVMSIEGTPAEPPIATESAQPAVVPEDGVLDEKLYTSPDGSSMKVSRMTANELSKKLASGEVAPVPVAPPIALPPVGEEISTVEAVSPAVEELNPETQKILAGLPPLADTPSAQASPTGNIGISRADPGIDLKQKDVLEHDEAVGVDLDTGRPPYDVSYDLEKAYEALIAGNTEEAVRVYQKALDADPDNTMALFGLATTYHRLGMLDQARPLYGKLLRLDPYNREALNNFLALVGEESPGAAIIQLEKLEGANPDFSPIPAQLSILYERIGQKENAIDKMVKAVTLSPENLVYKYNLAILYDRNDKVPEAITVYRQLLAAHDRGQQLPSDYKSIQERLTFLDSNYKG